MKHLTRFLSAIITESFVLKITNQDSQNTVSNAKGRVALRAGERIIFGSCLALQLIAPI